MIGPGSAMSLAPGSRLGPTAYAAMELLEGETLRQRLQDGALPARKAVEIALVQEFAPGWDTTATRRKLSGFDPDVAAESFGLAPDGTRLVVAGWVQLFSLMEAEHLPGLLAPPRGGAAR